MAGILHFQFDPYSVEKLLKLTVYEDQISKLIKDATLKEEDDRLMCDYLISLLNHLQMCGTSPNQTTLVLNFFTRFMKNTCQTNLIDAVRTLHRTLSSLNSLNEYQMKSVLDFLNRTYFQHYNLYKYVLTRPRQRDYTHLDKDIVVLEEPDPLCNGVEEYQWRYQEKVKSINRQHTAALNEVQNCARQSPVEKLNVNGCIHQDSIRDLVTMYIRKHCENIENEVELSLRVTELALEKEVSLLEACIVKNAGKDGNNNASPAPKKSPSRKSAAKSRK